MSNIGGLLHGYTLVGDSEICTCGYMVDTLNQLHTIGQVNEMACPLGNRWKIVGPDEGAGASYEHPEGAAYAPIPLLEDGRA